jgi:hypothetical protein
MRTIEPQDEDYVGQAGHERKVHRTHWQMHELKLKRKKKSKYHWVRTAPGKFMRILNEDGETEENPTVRNGK